MTELEISRLLAHITRRWPHAPLPVDSGTVWAADLADVPAEDALAAVREYATTEKFPPSSAWVRSHAERAAQGAPPSIDELQTFLSLHAGRLPYGERNTVQDTARAIAALEVVGAHEAVLRFVQVNGLHAVRFMPDASLQPLDPNQLADRRDMARGYLQNVIPAWHRDPRPGLALERACGRAALDAGELRAIAAAERHKQLAATFRRPQLPAGEPVASNEPTISPEDVVKLYREQRAQANAEERTAAAERRRVDAEEREVALAELQAHHAPGERR